MNAPLLSRRYAIFGIIGTNPNPQKKSDVKLNKEIHKEEIKSNRLVSKIQDANAKDKAVLCVKRKQRLSVAFGYADVFLQCQCDDELLTTLDNYYSEHSAEPLKSITAKVNLREKALELLLSDQYNNDERVYKLLEYVLMVYQCIPYY